MRKANEIINPQATRLTFKGDEMRDLLFRHLTSQDRRRKRIASCEISDKEGVRSVIRRHFVCMVKEIKDSHMEKPAPYVYVLKEHDSLMQREKFFCKIKGSVFATSKGKLFLIVFMHSLRICLTGNCQDVVK